GCLAEQQKGVSTIAGLDSKVGSGSGCNGKNADGKTIWGVIAYCGEKVSGQVSLNVLAPGNKGF
ncbi:MAG TPA: hypothetical protein PLG20_02775, partial [Candidatus Syntrophosphaera sp.]|nr:hypothetical protein [Candidatus Syntrophosphaera sp.]